MATSKKIIVLVLLVMTCAACASAPAELAGEADHPVNIRLVMSFRPDVQFAPFYVADKRGYFAENGIEIEFNHLPESESVKLLGTDEIQFAVVSGEQVLLARAQDLPVVYVMAWWHDYPVAVAAPKDSGIATPDDLVGKRVGFPGVYGASYIGFRALLSAAGIAEEAVTLDAIGFTQVEALYEGQEDAVIIYANNEPIQLAAQGLPVNVIRVADYVHLASNGLITNEKTIAENPDLIRRMVDATLHGIQDTIDDPEAAYEIAKDYVEGLEAADRSVLLGVLKASTEFWMTERPGFSDTDAWENMQDILLEMGMLEGEQDIPEAFTNEFIP
jgi:NitT/TauT family transport system substrate-binding protein